MTGLPKINEGARKAILVLVSVAVFGAGAPAIKVHAHDDAAFGHGHDAHGHSHSPYGTPDSEDGDVPDSADEGALHAHADGCVAVGLTSAVDREVSIPADGCRYMPRPATRPPDKPFHPPYRPPIA
jgi:hypothetical protein